MELNFSFSTALEFLKKGARVQRVGWNGKDMWLSMTPGRIVKVGDFWSDNNAAFAKSSGGKAEVAPYITMKTADDKIVPWLCSQTDMLAEDWQVVG